jgi:hypothetical protein
MAIEEDTVRREWGDKDKIYEEWGLFNSKSLMCIKL